MNKRRLRRLFWAFVCICLTFFLTWSVAEFVGQRTEVEGMSMSPTLKDKENLILDKISYRFRDPERYEIVVFPPKYKENTYYIKRVIGLPGETVQIVDGQILINGETYKEGRDFPVISNPGMASSPVTLESGDYFVLGDNRNNSEDSRYGSIGKVNKKYITGKLWFKLFPVKSIGFFE